MNKSCLAIIGLITTVGWGTPAAADVDGELLIMNASNTTMCAVIITTPEDDFENSPELLSANDLGCIQPGEFADVWYESLSDCYAVVEMFDDVGNNIYSNGLELCTQKHLYVTKEDMAGGD